MIYLVRHGQTEFNAAKRLQGQCDSALTPLGVEQARRMVPGEAGPEGAPEIEPAAAADENVTSLSSARQLK